MMGFYADKMFPWILDKAEPAELGRLRKLTLQDVSGDVLEIGLGTGGNLPHYPTTVQSLSAVEPSSGMHERAESRVAQTGRTVRWHQAKGEQLPFEQGRFDTVVTTRLLCSVDDVQKVLEEAFRILRPGGRYHFLEHAISRDPTIRRWQHRLNGLNKVISCGCELTRDIEQSIRNTEFEIEQLHEVPVFSRLDQKVFTHIRGVAVKPGGAPAPPLDLIPR